MGERKPGRLREKGASLLIHSKKRLRETSQERSLIAGGDSTKRQKVRHSPRKKKGAVNWKKKEILGKGEKLKRGGSKKGRWSSVGGEKEKGSQGSARNIGTKTISGN